ncbi:epiplakin [Aplochiton taeniatus]
MYKDLNAGTITVTEVSEMDSVRKYLKGTNSIAGVFVQSTKETMSIYQAKSKGLLTPGTSLVLLEAQAATGFVIDPVKNQKLSVEEAAAQGVIGAEWKTKLLSAERAVTGYTDPYTGGTISLFQALKKDLIVKDHGVRLLEAQIATGGIIDPVHSHRVPVEVAYQRGYFDEEMNHILSDPDDDTKGFFDPNTQENLTYLQLVERCVRDPSTGLSLLVIVKKGEFYFYVDEQTKLILKSTTTTKAGGKYQGNTVSLWDMLHSTYITEEKRRELVQQYKSGAITIQAFLDIVVTITQQQTTTTSASSQTQVVTSTTVTETTKKELRRGKSFHGIRKDVTADELLKSHIINEQMYKDLNAGTITVTEVSEMDSVRKYLKGTNSIAGVFVQSTKETMSIYKAKSKGLLTPGTSLVLLEAQAATGFVIDPVKNQKLSVEEAAAQGVIGAEWKTKLLSAERAVTGYTDPYTGDTISLFQALKKDLIVKDHGVRLLEAQIATGGIIDPVHSHRVPVEVAYQRGYFDEEMNHILSDPDDDTKGFFDPNTQENLTYLQLVERCVRDTSTGLSLLVIVKKGEFYFYVDEQTKLILKSTTTTKAGGKYQGKTVSLWDLLHSTYITEEKRRELVQQYKSGAITIQAFLDIVVTITQQQTTTTSASSQTQVVTSTTVTETTKKELRRGKSFHGIRKDVTADELLKSHIINEQMYKDLNAGTITVTEVSEMDSVRKYLKGTNSIAGVFVQSTKETMSIYQAKSKGLLTPGTSLVLLEAQAATGFVIDPVKNQKLSVEEAAAQGVIGAEWKTKLLSAERAVTGYTDPYTGGTISLFQALKKDLIVKDHGVRLLEAQIATGGIIDPVHSHRVPVEVAYQRGYFDEEMNHILSDPDDDTKGFFDPNTQENLTYLQLVERCVRDPSTGLSLLVIVKKGEFYFYVDEQTKLILKSTTTTKAGGKYQGKTVSLWDLLHSTYITEEKRRELVQQYKSGAITIQAFLDIVVTITQQQTTTTSASSQTQVVTSTTVTETTKKELRRGKSFHGIRKDVTADELLKSHIINEQMYKDLNAGTITVTEVSEMDSVRKYLKGTNSIAGVFVQSTKETMSIYQAKSKGLLTPGTSLVLLEAQAATGFVIDPVKNQKLSVEEAAAQGVIGAEWKTKLLSAERAVTGYTDPYTGGTISLFQALKKDLIVKDHGVRLLEAQIATGGIIDPVHSHRVPVEVAYQRGYFDEEMNHILSDPDDDTKGFFDPNTQENLTYLQLVERCVRDPSTGLSLLVIVKKGEFYFYVDEQTKLILKSTTTTKAGGKYQGKTVSLWDLLHSTYITEEKRRELVQQYKSGAITIQAFLDIVVTITQQQTTTTSASSQTQVVTSTTVTETTKKELRRGKSFHGIRKDVTADELLKSHIINEQMYKDLNAGTITVTEVSEMDSVRKYLKGTNSIAGVFVQSTKETMSIYQAKSKGLLTPGTSLVLLEAQAATGFVIDPVKNQKLSVEEAAAQGVIGAEWKTKLLSAERAVTGYTDPYTGGTISLFQALKKDLIVKDHGVRLLEAQIATGGIIDPVHSHRVPVEVAYQRGYFDEEMNHILSDPDDDTKGFFDPNTQENLTYLQLVERCVRDPSTGLSLLVIVKKGEFYFYVDEQTKLILKSTTTTKAGGKYQGKTVSLWDLLHSTYITEEKRRELVQQYKSGAITIQAFLDIVVTITQQQTTTTSASSQTQVVTSTTVTETTKKELRRGKSFHGIRKDVTADELLKSHIINEQMYKDLNAGTITVTEVSEMDSVRKYLKGTNSIAGVFVQSTKETMSIYQAKSKGLLTPGTSLVLLEAQAATGFVIDPVKNQKLSVEEAAAQGVIGAEWKTKLLSAERAVTGYTDPYTGGTISLFQALKKDLIVKDHGVRLLEAQIATGGIIDPVHSHRVPVEVAYQRGYFDEEMNHILSDPDDDTKGFFDPNTQENLTYLQLVERCVRDPSTGLSLLVIVKKGEFYFYVDEQTKLILKSTTTTKAGGKYQGKTVSLWDLLHSTYITEEKRRELVQQYKSGAITIQAFLDIVVTITQQQTTTTSASSQTQVVTSTTVTETTKKELRRGKSFHGIRKDVTADELLKSHIINEQMYKDLNAGTITVTEVSEMDSVRKYLKGTNSIAGVFVQSTKETMSIYQAKSKGLLTPGTSLVLLEAQAATGFVIDPVKNQKLSVEEAAAQGVIGAEWKTKLLSAERAVTGYTDPYTGGTISLFQALKKDLIVKDHGVRLLEAQIATGGIIDPVHSHRVPVEVAYQRGYFDEEMNHILSDPDDDTKGFFDPNTQENLTYLQLVERCVRDPSTGLSLLVIVKKGEFYFYVDEQTKLILKSTTTTKAGGKYQGKTVSLWDLLHSTYITEEKRRELVQQYKSGAITIQAFLDIVVTITQQQTTTTSASSQTQVVTSTTVTETTKKELRRGKSFHGIRKDVTADELLKSHIINEQMYKDLNAGTITVTEVSEMDSVRKYLKGTNSIAGVFVQSTKETMSIYKAKSKGLLTPGTSLVLLEAQAATGFVIDPVKNQKLSVEEAAAQGVIGAEWKTKLLSAERAVTGYTDPYTGDTISLFQALKKDLIVKDHGVRLLEAQIATGGIIDPVHSHRVPVEVAYQRGYFDEEMNHILSDPDDDTKGFFDPNTQENLTYLQLVERCVRDPSTGLSLLVIVKKGEFYFYVDEQTKLILKSTTTTKAGGKYQGKTVSLWDLLHSTYITEEKRRELVQQYKSGAITIQAFLDIVVTITQQQTTTTSASSQTQVVTSTTVTETTKKELRRGKSFHGIRKDVTADELLKSHIINEQMYKDLNAGTITVTEVSEMDSVRKYLKGTNSIAGVFVQSTKETMSIYQAKSKGLLTPGTSLVLLEAQAATGFVIDPVKNQKLSVEEAAAQGVIGAEWKTKLLSAERAVTGYTDPYTGGTISLFQALKKDLIVKDHGVRLLEAQIATGGIIDPVHSHRVPVEVAYQRGYFDEEMNHILSDPDDDTKGFFDPNTQENLTYLQLVERCVRDPSTGLSLLVIVKKGEFYFYVDEQTKLILKSTTTTKAGGKYQGKTVSLWDLLHSTYITEEKRRELVQQYKSGAITIQAFLDIVVTITQQQTTTTSASSQTQVVTSTTVTETTKKELRRGKSFHGIRKDVTADELLKSHIINEQMYKDLNAGTITVTEVSEMDSVRKYLKGTNSIAGVFVQSTKETMSIYQAKSKGLLTPGTSLVLLEAQAATGFVIDPVKNQKLSVEEAAAQGVIGAEWKTKLLSAERAVTGYTDPYTGGTISLFQALKKDLIVKDHGVRLLEAQIATGGIIDPVHSHRVPVEVAYQRGYFDEEMNHILSDPDDDTKGFFDPNTQENLTYLQLVERCVRDPSTGLSLLVIVKKGEFYFYVDEQTKLILKSTTTTKAGGKYQGKTVSLWDLLHSTYITEEKRRELVQQYKSGAITIQAFLDIVVTITQQQTTTTSASSQTQVVTSTTVTETTKKELRRGKSFHGIRKDVTADELLKSHIINEQMYKDLNAGTITVTEVSEMDSVRKYLKGTNSIAGVFVQSTKETMSIYKAKSKGLLTPGTSLVLLEAQAATGFVIDPVKNQKLSVEEAAAQGVIGAEWKTKLLSAERAVTGYTDPYTGGTISLFQALKKDLIVKDHGVRLLEAQIATGGIIDPVHSHRVPVEVAYQRGYFDEEMNHILSDTDDDTKGFFDPNTQENLTYLQLVERCVRDPSTGLSLLVIVKKGEFYFYVDEQTKLILKSTTTTKAGGKYQGKTVSLWDLLHSTYITEEKRRELVQQYKSGAITIQAFLDIVVTITQQQTTTTSASSQTQVVTSTTVTETTKKELRRGKSFHGIRKDVTADELLKSHIINEQMYKDLNAGTITVTEVSEMDSVRKYLKGTNSIAGVFVQSTKETMSIYQAKSKGLLTPGTSLVLLEAQAATGFVIDPVKNQKLSVEEAAAQGVIGAEWKTKLLSAERAVTGYTDPYTGGTISLFQALKKDLIVKDHGVRLLEAQIATGGIIDPVHSHRVPVEVAYQRGYFDEEMNHILSDPDDDTKGFFDPNTQENLTYLQLVERCVRDPSTGLSLLVIVKKGEFYFYVDEQTKLILKSTTTTKAGGKYQGKTVSLWDLLHSTYITEEKRRELVQQYKSGAITIQAFLDIVVTITQQQTTTTSASSQTQVVTSTTVTETTKKELRRGKSFHGIRKDVTADELLKSHIINEQMYKDLNAGTITVTEVSEMDSVRKYLKGTNSIAGVFVQSTKETMSIYKAKSKGLLTPGTSLVLLEAQAATGFVIDPVKNQKLSVEEAAAQGVIGAEWKTKLLSAERAVTGYTDPYTGGTISLFQALKKDLIVKDHGVRLLEAQIATGGIIDPVHSHRVPVEVAYQRGYFDEEMNHILSDPDDDTKGFFDPNTQENLTYLQLVERCVRDPSTGLSLLVIVKKGEFYFYVDEQTKLILKSTTTTKAGGKYQGKTVSLWDLLHSTYITEEKRRELVQQYKSGAITIQAFLDIVVTITQQQTTTTSASSQTQVVTSTTVTETTKKELRRGKGFHGIRKDVTADELLKSHIINEQMYKDLNAGTITVTEVSEMDSVRKYLKGTNSIAGVFVQSTKETMSIYQAKSKGLLTPGTSLVLLEAQAATGFVIDPVKNQKLSVEEAAAQGVIGAEWKTKLLSAERAVTGYTDPYTGGTISLFQALKKDLIVKDHGVRLLEAQIATGGIIDPVHSHRVPVEVAYQRGYFDEEMNHILSDTDDDTKGFFDPNTQENLTYLQLVERCVRDPSTGLSLLVIVKKGEFYFYVDEQTKLILKSTTTTKAGGKYQGKTVSLWDLLHSTYITEEKRRELVQQYKSGAITIQAFLDIVVTITQQQTTTTSASSQTQVVTSTTVTETTKKELRRGKSFHGIRKDVTADELLKSHIINEQMYKDLNAGTITVTEVSEMDSVRKYLKGTNSIAGVFVQSTKETMSIYQAKSKGLLTPGTSLVLLEAQAATGFVIDPVKNQKLSVEEAAAQGVIGAEWKTKLLSAERAVTGYTDPYTGGTISLFQALKKDLIVKDHGVRLLEAQIATGGIIDPVHSHRVPVEVAYQRGYFDEEMNHILSDPDDDTKGFFDPNTQENLTYLQLVERCVRDPSTGLSLLVIVKKGEFYFYVDEQTKLILKSTTTTKAGGKYQGKTVSLWDLLHSTYITEEKRRELVQQYKSGAITIQAFLDIVVTITQQQTTTTSASSQTQVVTSTTVTETTKKELRRGKSFHGIRKDVTADELLKSHIINEQMYKDLNAGTITVTEVSEMDSVRKYLKGTNSIAGVFVQSTKETMSIYKAKSKGLLTPGTSLVLLEAQAATGFVIDPVKNQKLSVEEAAAQGVIGAEWKTKLLSAERAVTGYTDPYTGGTISLFQALKKDLIVKDHGVRLLEAQIATGGIIDPVHSHRVPVEVAYQRGYFDEEMNHILSDPDDDTKGFFDPNTQENLTYLQLVERCVRDPSTGLSLLVIVKKGEFYFYVDEQTKLILKSTTTTKAGGKYQGKTVSLWDLLHSTYITEEKRRELVQQYKSGAITIQAFLDIVVTITQQQTTTTSASSQTQVVTSTTVTETTKKELRRGKSFHGIRKDVTADELLKSHIINEQMYKDLNAGTITVTEVSEMDSVRKYLKGTNSIAGVFVQSTKETMSIYKAKSKGLLTPGTSLVLLEAQAATGFVIDPVKNQKLSVEEAAAQGVIGAEWKTKLLSAERAVTGYTDPYTGGTISLFQALKKDLIVKDHGVRLLEAQIATGGIIDPVHSHRVPVEVAYQRRYFDEEMNHILSDPDDDTKGFFDPNTQENLTYLQLVERCVRDPSTGLSLLVIVKKGEFYFYVDEQTKLILKSTTTTKAGGKYQGKTVSLWDLLHSTYITEEKRRELVQQYKSGAITIQAFLDIVVTITQQQTTTTSASSQTQVVTSTTVTETTKKELRRGKSFHGIRKDVTADELLKSHIINEQMYKDLNAGTITVTEVSEMDSVRKYLKGTNSIAGVFVQSTKETMSIYQAKSKGLLTPGTSLVLLEAQAATGFVIDPVKNQKLSVEEAAAQGVIGAEWKTKLLSAERAVTGYTDPYTGDTISLFQALKKDLIVKDHGVRLLEAQIATGGIIDPVHSHRVPVEVAYQRGYFDEEMNHILSDPDDDTKGFFDPNTQENLTYLQLVERCVRDPSTGLSLLSLNR